MPRRILGGVGSIVNCLEQAPEDRVRVTLTFPELEEEVVEGAL